jgi:hypothetical protein
MRYIAILAISAWCMAVLPVNAKDPTQALAYKQVLSACPAAELPAKAASLVKKAKSADQKTTTIKVVKTAVAINPASAPAIVGAVARAVPSVAAIAASTAAAEQPKQAAAIAKAAAAAAPDKAKEIQVAVVGAVPSQKAEVEKSVSVYMAADAAGGQAPKGWYFGPPFVPLAGTPQNITPDTSGEFPGGPRNYSRP